MHPEQEAEPRASRRGVTGTILAWSVILLLTALVIGVPRSGPRPQGADGVVSKRMFELESQYLLGASLSVGDPASDLLHPTRQRWKAPTDWQRLRWAVVAGERAGPKAALDRLQAGDASSPSEAEEPDQDAVAGILSRLFEDYSQDKLSAPSDHQACG